MVILKLNYCRSLLYGINQYLIAKLQRVQNASARLIMRSHRITHTSPILQELHWSQIKDRIIFSVVVNVCKALHGKSPQYIRNLLCYRKNKIRLFKWKESVENTKMEKQNMCQKNFFLICMTI